MYEIKGKYTNALMTLDDFEEEMVNQVHKMTNHVAFENPIAIMPDGHQGKTSCIGFTMPLGSKIIPEVVSMDIGCGVLVANIGKNINISLEDLDIKIRENIPMGINVHESAFKINSKEKFSFSKHFPWEELNEELLSFTRAYNQKFKTNYSFKPYDYRDFGALCNKININQRRNELSICSLGSGNHFISIEKSEKNGDLWILLHSGSRNFGKCVCTFHQNKAIKILNTKRNIILKSKIEEITKGTKDKSTIQKQINESKKELGLDFDFDVKGLEFLEDDDAFEYLIDMIVAQKYAEFNRKMMLNTICMILGGVEPIETIESVHNYIDFRDFVIRKGAIRSYAGERMIVPLNMRDGSLICEGKSNPDWNFSCSHGAGRNFSRSYAKQNIDLENFKKQMKEIYSTSVCKGTLDEAPDAYKDSKMIEEAIEPTATVIDKIKPILNIKDNSSDTSWKERREEKKNK